MYLFMTRSLNWAKVRSQGYRFAYIRASYGVENNRTVMDTMFPSHWAGLEGGGNAARSLSLSACSSGWYQAGHRVSEDRQAGER